MQPLEAVVVGGGVIGAAVLHGIASRGMRRVLLLEQGPVLAGGATGRSGAMVRVYHSDAWLTGLAAESFGAFARFQERFGGPCGFVKTGSLYFDSASRRDVLADACERWGRPEVPLVLLDRRQGLERFPGLAWSADELAVHEPESGYADPVLTTFAIARAAERLGAEVRTGVRVTRVLSEGGRVVGVQSGEGPIRCPLVVLACGPWIRELLEPLGLDLGFYNKVIQTVHLGSGPAAASSPHPCFFDIRSRSFARPDRDSGSHVGVATGERQPGPAMELPLDEDESALARELAGRRLPSLRGLEPDSGVRTVDCYCPSRRGVLAWAPNVRGLFLAAGFSGAGFKLAPAAGARAAEAITAEVSR